MSLFPERTRTKPILLTIMSPRSSRGPDTQNKHLSHARGRERKALAQVLTVRGHRQHPNSALPLSKGAPMPRGHAPCGRVVGPPPALFLPRPEAHEGPGVFSNSSCGSSSFCLHISEAQVAHRITHCNGRSFPLMPCDLLNDRIGCSSQFSGAEKEEFLSLAPGFRLGQCTLLFACFLRPNCGPGLWSQGREPTSLGVCPLDDAEGL